MVQFGAFAPGRSRVWGLSHSEIRGSQLLCSSPQLIAALHVLHRLSVPRHPPCALRCFCLLACTCLCAAPARSPSKQPLSGSIRTPSGLLVVATHYVKEHRPDYARHKKKKSTTLKYNFLPACTPKSTQVELAGVEPATSCLQGRRSSQLSYSPDWWAWEELNLRPHAYQACALTT